MTSAPSSASERAVRNRDGAGSAGPGLRAAAGRLSSMFRACGVTSSAARAKPRDVSMDSEIAQGTERVINGQRRV
jgi:hypothetical protein